MDELKVNDGGGLLDSDGIIDSLIVDCNRLPKQLIDNQFVSFCNNITQMVQKLTLLKKGIMDDRNSLTEQIKTLREQINEGGS